QRREEVHVGAAGGAPCREVDDGMQHHCHGRGQQPGTATHTVAPKVNDQQAGGKQVQHGRDENDCHRRSVAQPVRVRSRAILRNRFSKASQVPAAMFESLTQRLSGTVERLRGRGRLSEENIRESLREVRIALLEADVALPVVQAMVERIKVRAVGQEVLKSLTPGQALIKIVRDEMTAVMGSQASDLNLNVP